MFWISNTKFISVFTLKKRFHKTSFAANCIQLLLIVWNFIKLPLSNVTPKHLRVQWDLQNREEAYNISRPITQKT